MVFFRKTCESLLLWSLLQFACSTSPVYILTIPHLSLRSIHHSIPSSVSSNSKPLTSSLESSFSSFFKPSFFLSSLLPWLPILKRKPKRPLSKITSNSQWTFFLRQFTSNQTKPNSTRTALKATSN